MCVCVCVREREEESERHESSCWCPESDLSQVENQLLYLKQMFFHAGCRKYLVLLLGNTYRCYHCLPLPLFQPYTSVAPHNSKTAGITRSVMTFKGFVIHI